MRQEPGTGYLLSDIIHFPYECALSSYPFGPALRVQVTCEWALGRRECDHAVQRPFHCNPKIPKAHQGEHHSPISPILIFLPRHMFTAVILQEWIICCFSYNIFQRHRLHCFHLLVIRLIKHIFSFRTQNLLASRNQPRIFEGIQDRGWGERGIQFY